MCWGVAWLDCLSLCSCRKWQVAANVNDIALASPFTFSKGYEFIHHFISLLFILSRWCHFNWISDLAISKSIKKKLSFRTYVCTIYIFIYFKYKLLLLQVHFFILCSVFVQNISRVCTWKCNCRNVEKRKTDLYLDDLFGCFIDCHCIQQTTQQHAARWGRATLLKYTATAIWPFHLNSPSVQHSPHRTALDVLYNIINISNNFSSYFLFKWIRYITLADVIRGWRKSHSQV